MKLPAPAVAANAMTIPISTEMMIRNRLDVRN